MVNCLILWVLVFNPASSKIAIGQYQTYEHCFQQQKVCNEHYVGNPCICTVKEAQQ